MDDNDELETRQGVAITEVLSTGTARNGLAYVELRFAEEPDPALVLFPKELAQTVCQGFLEAASRLDVGQPPGAKPVSAIPVREATLHMTTDTARTGRMVLILTTESGARLAFGLPEGARDELVEGIWEALRATGEMDWLN